MGEHMNTGVIRRVLGVALVCVGIYFHLSWPLPLLVFGVGLVLMFLP
jgi:hypothetical protein